MLCDNIVILAGSNLTGAHSTFQWKVYHVAYYMFSMQGMPRDTPFILLENGTILGTSCCILNRGTVLVQTVAKQVLESVTWEIMLFSAGHPM